MAINKFETNSQAKHKFTISYGEMKVSNRTSKGKEREDQQKTDKSDLGGAYLNSMEWDSNNCFR